MVGGRPGEESSHLKVRGYFQSKFNCAEVSDMGILDTIQALAGQAGQAAGTDQAKVAGGFIEALTQHPEGIQGVLDAFKNNGMAEHVNNWGAGQAATATPDQ